MAQLFHYCVLPAFALHALCGFIDTHPDLTLGAALRRWLSLTRAELGVRELRAFRVLVRCP